MRRNRYGQHQEAAVDRGVAEHAGRDDLAVVTGDGRRAGLRCGRLSVPSGANSCGQPARISRDARMAGTRMLCVMRPCYLAAMEEAKPRAARG
jgi:hypothetical protein